MCNRWNLISFLLRRPQSRGCPPRDSVTHFHAFHVLNSDFKEKGKPDLIDCHLYFPTTNVSTHKSFRITLFRGVRKHDGGIRRNQEQVFLDNLCAFYGSSLPYLLLHSISFTPSFPVFGTAFVHTFYMINSNGQSHERHSPTPTLLSRPACLGREGLLKHPTYLWRLFAGQKIPHFCLPPFSELPKCNSCWLI